MKHQSELDGIDRRQFISRSGIALIGASVTGLSCNKPLADDGNTDAGSFQKDGWKGSLQEALKYRKIDAHNHVNFTNRTPAEIDKSCELLGITRTACSVSNGRTPQQIRENNDLVLKAMKEFPNRIMGQCFINPGFKKEALEEIDRCVDNGMVMLGELYDAYRANDPLYYPVIERCIKHKIPLLWHATASLGNWRKGFFPAAKPGASIAEDFVELGKRVS